MYRCVCLENQTNCLFFKPCLKKRFHHFFELGSRPDLGKFCNSLNWIQYTLVPMYLFPVGDVLYEISHVTFWKVIRSWSIIAYRGIVAFLFAIMATMLFHMSFPYKPFSPVSLIQIVNHPSGCCFKRTDFRFVRCMYEVWV